MYERLVMSWFFFYLCGIYCVFLYSVWVGWGFGVIGNCLGILGMYRFGIIKFIKVYR